MNKKIFMLLPALALMLGACTLKKSSSESGSESGGGDSGSSSETIAVEGVTISKQSATLDPGEVLQLTAVATPSTLPDKSVVWSSDTAAVATVSSSGKVTAVAEGTAKIKAAAKADSSKFAECVVTVNKEQVIVAATSADTEKTFKLGCWQANLGSYYYFKGSVDSSTRGETTTAWADGVDVKLEEDSGHYKVKILGSNKYFEMTDDHHFQVADTATILWDWNDTAKTVSRTISTTTYFPGTYNQYDTISGCDISMLASDFVFQFLYKIDAVDPTSIDITEAAVDVNQGDSVQLHATLGPVGAVGTIEWSVTGNEKVHVSDAGLVTVDADAVVDSTATITATCGTLHDECVVTVKAAPSAITSMEEIYASGQVDDEIDVKGVYVGAYGNKTNEWYIANGDYGLYLYQVDMPAGLTVGDSVRVQGKLGLYKGLVQVVKDGAVVEKVADVISYNTLSYTGGAFAKALLSRPVQLTGTVKEGKAITGSANVTVVVTVGGTDINVFVKKSYGLDYTALNTALGTTSNTVTLKGYVAIFDGANPVNYETSTGYQIVSPSVVA